MTLHFYGEHLNTRKIYENAVDFINVKKRKSSSWNTLSRK